MKIERTYAKIKDETVDVHEKFIPYGTKTIDSKQRITLGAELVKTISKEASVDSYKVLVGANGDILLRPTVSVPLSEAWVFANPKVLDSLKKGLKEAGAGKAIKVKNVSSFLKKL